MDFAAIGIELPRSPKGNARVLCPRCSESHNNGNRTLSCDTDRGLFQCFRCGWKGRVAGDVAWTEYRPDPTALETQKRKRQYAIDCVLSESMPITAGSAAVARRYLRHRLGGLPDPLPALRYHPRLRYYHDGDYCGDYPALVAEIRDISGRLVTLHRTYLTEDGRKANLPSPKKIMGVPQGSCSGAAIRLYPASDELILAEGIETALALAHVMRLPAWACISAHGLKSVLLPKSVRRIHIGADNDRSGTGERAARTLAYRLWRDGLRDILIHTPDEAGADWADQITKGVHPDGN